MNLQGASNQLQGGNPLQTASGLMQGSNALQGDTSGLANPYTQQAGTNLNSAVAPTGGLQMDPNSVPYDQSNAGAMTPEKGNWFTRLLPAGAGVGGGLLGGFLAGEAVDPLGGGIVGALLSLAAEGAGAAAGGGLAGAAGQQAENTFTGTTGSTTKAGIENALSNALGAGIGKGFGYVAGKAGSAALTGAAKLFAGQAPEGAISSDVAKYVSGIGEQNLGKANQMSNIITGSTDSPEGQALNTKFVESKLGNNPINLSDLHTVEEAPTQVNEELSGLVSNFSPDVAKLNPSLVGGEAPGKNFVQNAIEKNYISQVPGASTGVISNVNSVLQPLISEYGGDLSKVTPEEALNVQRQISNLASKATDKNIVNTYNQISSELNQRLGLDKISVSAEEQAAHADNLEQALSSVNPKAAKAVGNEIRNLDNPTLADFRSIEEPWVKVSQGQQEAEIAASNTFGTSPAKMLSKVGSAVNITKPVQALGAAGDMASSFGNTGLGKLLRAGGSTLTNKNVGRLGSLLTRTATAIPANAPNIVASLGGTNMQGGAAGTPLSGGAGPQGTQGAGGAGTGQATPMDIINQIYQNYVAAPAGPNASQELSALQALVPYLGKSQLASSIASQIPGAFSAAGGAQGPGGGIVSNILGLIPGTAQNYYKNLQGSLSSSLGGALGLSPQDAQSVIAGIAPRFTQNAGTAAKPLSAEARVDQLLGQYQ